VVTALALTAGAAKLAGKYICARPRARNNAVAAVGDRNLEFINPSPSTINEQRLKYLADSKRLEYRLAVLWGQ
jgi:hypothetical protein